MSAALIDGKTLAKSVEAELTSEVAKLTDAEKKPGLVVLLVGDNPASQTYVAAKQKACDRVGIHSETVRLPESISEMELLARIDEYNNDDTFDGILVQLPLPKHITEETVLEQVRPDKDVDCFHPENVGRMVIGDAFVHPCTPAGIVELIKSTGVPTSGKHAVVIGRSNIVGKPIANMLVQPGMDCTVTVTHSRTADLKAMTVQADILVAAVGRPEFVSGDMIKPGSVVIDVGINRVDADTDKGYKIVGDVDFDAAMDVAAHVTPVPGGVGKMTIAMLLRNTLACARLHLPK